MDEEHKKILDAYEAAIKDKAGEGVTVSIHRNAGFIRFRRDKTTVITVRTPAPFCRRLVGIMKKTKKIKYEMSKLASLLARARDFHKRDPKIVYWQYYLKRAELWSEYCKYNSIVTTMSE